jgi:hypothetical protein
LRQSRAHSEHGEQQQNRCQYSSDIEKNTREASLALCYADVDALGVIQEAEAVPHQALTGSLREKRECQRGARENGPRPHILRLRDLAALPPLLQAP